MGSMIHLAVGRLEIDWGKNFGFTDHSALFQISDLAKVPYYYAEEGGADLAEDRGPGLGGRGGQLGGGRCRHLSGRRHRVGPGTAGDHPQPLRRLDDPRRGGELGELAAELLVLQRQLLLLLDQGGLVVVGLGGLGGLADVGEADPRADRDDREQGERRARSALPPPVPPRRGRVEGGGVGGRIGVAAVAERVEVHGWLPGRGVGRLLRRVAARSGGRGTRGEGKNGGGQQRPTSSAGRGLWGVGRRGKIGRAA